MVTTKVGVILMQAYGVRIGCGSWRYFALCPELDIASQGEDIEEARGNLKEAIELFFETADSSEIQSGMHEEVFVTRLEVAVG